MKIDIKQAIKVTMPPVEAEIVIRHISTLETQVHLFEENEKAHWAAYQQLQAQNAKMLEALKRIVYHHDEQTHSTVEYLDFALHAARAAIAEAENTEPPHTRATII